MKNFKIVLIICVFVLNGCTFRDRLWEAKIDEGEVVQDLLISEDGYRVVVLGRKYDYFLKDDKQLIQNLMKWDGKNGLVVNINAITAEGEKVEARVIIEGNDKKLSENQSNLMWQDLLGIRYLSGLKRNEYESNFVSTGLIKTPQRTSIFENPTKLEKAGKVLITPFAIAADIILLPITIPIFVNQQVKESKTDYFCEGDFCGYDRVLNKDNSSK